MSQPRPILDSIRTMLDGAGITHRLVHHAETRTSEESAAARGEDLRVGGKAILAKVGDTFRLFVLSAVLRLDSAAIRRRFDVKGIRFATAQELLDLTGLVPGCVPPFGRPILPFDLYIDESIKQNERIAFNAGSLTDSIIMSVSDYQRIAGGEVFAFGAAPPTT
jgi:prolyl-tRNA editing enzyme YbaK/EbsC (Cys-tRNA(Pro) deacylase)